MRKTGEERRKSLAVWIETYPGRINLAAHQEDLALCKDYLQGNRKPFEKMFQIAYGKLQSFVYCHSFGKHSGIHVNTQDKEDVIAETVDVALRRMGTYCGWSLFSTWMIAIARYRILSLIEKRCREQQMIKDSPKEGFQEQPPQKARQSFTVWELLSGLSAQDAQIVQLRAIDELSFPKIAAQLGSSVSKITFRYKKIIKILRAEQTQTV